MDSEQGWHALLNDGWSMAAIKSRWNLKWKMRLRITKVARKVAANLQQEILNLSFTAVLLGKGQWRRQLGWDISYSGPVLWGHEL